MSRTGKIIIWTAGVLILLLVAMVIFISTFNWNRLKPTINRQVSTELNRPFAIRGDLGIAWERDRLESGWRSWVPWPHIHAQDIMLGNPPAFPDLTMAHLERVDAAISPLALLGKQIWLPQIKLQQPQIKLVQLAEGKNNWTFNLATSDANSSPSSWSFRLDNIVFDQGLLSYRDAVNKADVQITADPLGKPVPYAQLAGGDDRQQGAADFIFGWQASGTYNREKLTGEGKFGGMLSSTVRPSRSRFSSMCAAGQPAFAWSVRYRIR